MPHIPRPLWLVNRLGIAARDLTHQASQLVDRRLLPRRYVLGPTVGWKRGPRGQQVGPHRIGHKSEVPALLAVTKDHWRFATKTRLEEPGDDRRIR